MNLRPDIKSTESGVKMNCFKSPLVGALGFTIFSNEEFEAAFRRIDKDGSGFITPDELEALLFETYGFEPLEEEIEILMKEFDINQDGKISLEEFITNLEKVKSKVGGTHPGEVDETGKKKPSLVEEINEKYKAPITYAQRVGFHLEDETEKEIMKMDTYPKNK
mmetsp:Transcript_3936/g.3693  ORF Transcript_3936/g.3693 Transcript_3936/m.3693 type:complete len:164 (+) Transcript_3936:3-494(+)